MGVFEMVVLVVAVGCTAGVIRSYLERRNVGVDPTHLREIDARLTRLESIDKRLQVVEKIVTDRRYDLRQEFEQLEGE